MTEGTELASAEETTIQVLFDRDPLELSDQDIGKIVEHLREGRARYVSGEAQAGSAKTAKASKAKKPEKPLPEGLQLSLDDLDL